jgi:Leucine-rich repeat (LRR) protein
MNAYYARWDFSKLNKLERLTVADGDIRGIAASLDINTLPKSLTELSLDLLFTQNTEGLILLTNLTKLRLSHYGGIRSRLTNFSVIENLTKLTELHVDAGDADLSPLTNLVALKSLSLSLSSDISTVYKLKNVTELSLQLRDSALNLSELLDNLENLATLEVAGTEVELSSEFNIHNPLKSFSISMNVSNKLTNIDFISKLMGVEILSLGSIGEVDLSPLETLTQLKSINISGVGFSVLPDLSGAKALTEVKLSGNEGLNSIDGLTKLSSLTHLSLGYMGGLSSISSLSRLDNLSELYLYNSKVADLFSTVGQLTQLKELSIINSNEDYSASKDVFRDLL